MIQAVAVLATAVTLLVFLYVGYSNYRRRSDYESYFFFGWRLDSQLVSATIFASGMSLATVIIALLQLTGFFGIALMWAVISYCIGWSVLIFLSKTIKAAVQKGETLHTYLGRVSGEEKIRKVASFVTLVGFAGTFATELFAAEVVIKTTGLGSSQATFGMFIFAAITTAYSALGGFNSIVLTDRIQAFVLWPAVILISGFAIYLGFSSGVRFEAEPFQQWTLPVATFISIGLINIAFPVTDLSAWQRISAATSHGDFRKGGQKAIGQFFLSWTMLIIAGCFVAQISGGDSFAFVFAQVATETGLSLLFFVVVLPGLVAAMLSTADTFLNAASHTFLFDLSSSSTSGEDAVKSGRKSVVKIGLAAFLFAFMLREIGFDIVSMVFSVYGLSLALFPTIVYALFFSQKGKPFPVNAALWSVYIGLIAGLVNSLYAVTFAALDIGWLTPGYVPSVYMTPVIVFLASSVVFACGWIVGQRA